jgi:hypothetical protein
MGSFCSNPSSTISTIQPISINKKSEEILAKFKPINESPNKPQKMSFKKTEVVHCDIRTSRKSKEKARIENHREMMPQKIEKISFTRILTNPVKLTSIKPRDIKYFEEDKQIIKDTFCDERQNGDKKVFFDSKTNRIVPKLSPLMNNQLYKKRAMLIDDAIETDVSMRLRGL